MTLPIEYLLLEMREHQHLPGMPRIQGGTTTATCLHCGQRGSVRPGRRGKVQPVSGVENALMADCAGADAPT